MSDPTVRIRELLKELEREVATLPADTRDRVIGRRQISQLQYDMYCELTWWRPKCDVCGAYVGDKLCKH